jgi:hypothetical protein
MFYPHVEYFMVRLVYFPRFGMLCKEKSGNNAQVPRREGKIMEQIIF